MKNLKFMNQATKDNVVASTVNLISLLNVKVVTSSVKDIVLRNPNYPSLLAISESLDHWKINNEAYRVDKDKIDVLPTPFIAQLNDNVTSLVVVKATDNNSVVYLKDGGSGHRVSRAKFQEQWTGVTLLAETSSASGQTDYKTAKGKETLRQSWAPILLCLIAVVVINQLWVNVPNLAGGNLTYYIVIWISAICGAFVTSLLLWHEYDENNVYLKKICSINKKTNCNAVLSSKGAKILGFSWSELGAFYFFGILFYLLVTPLSRFSLFPLIIFNIFTFPYIFFSIYYQSRVVKQWCVLCLAIQGILLLDFFAIILTGQLSSNISGYLAEINLRYLALAFLLPPLVWMAVKPYIYDKKESDEVKYSFFRFKSNSEVFNSILSKQPSMKAYPAGLGITIGNKDAENLLVKVCNPYCGPCGQYFPDLLEVVRANANLKVQIVFTGRPNKDDQQAIVIAHLLDIDEANPDITVQALTDWYTSDARDYQRFRTQYTNSIDFEHHKEKIAAMHSWCATEQIQATPTYFINGHMLPESYSLKDLQGMFN
jgi:uncharacterized membrane protein